jgi:N-methylhydantoinase A
VYFRGVGFIDTPCYGRDQLTPGMRFDGPAVVDQDDATVLVAPGFRARIDAATDVILERL